MTDLQSSSRDSDWFRSWQVYVVIGFVLCLHVVWWVISDFSVARHQLVDGDSYARILRVLRLLETGDWFDVSLPRANAPFGGSVHWTRILDLVILAFSLPFLPFVELQQAIYLSCVIIGPVQHIVLVVAVIWAARALVSHQAACLAGALTTVQVGIFIYSTVGRADHHVLFAIFFILSIGYMARLLAEPNSQRAATQAFFSGLAIAGGLWIGPEALFLLAICLLAGGLPWLTGQMRLAVLNRNLLFGLSVGLSVVLLIERGIGGFLEIQYDRVSIVHFALSVLVLAFWMLIARTERVWGTATTPKRLGIALGGAFLTIGILITLFPSVYLGPMANVDPVFRDIFKKIMEFASITDLPHFVLYLGGTVFALPWVCFRIGQTKAPEKRWAWGLLAIGLIVYIPLTIDSIRSCIYTGLFSAILVADLVIATDRYINRTYRGLKRSVTLASALIFLIVGPFSLGSLLVHAQTTEKKRYSESQNSCPIYQFTEYLGSNSTDQHIHTILTSPNFGPEIMYRTPHYVLGTMHHPNTDGIKAGKKIMESRDNHVALKIIQHRKIDMLLICEDSGSNGYVEDRSDDSILFNRVLAGNLPDWLKEVKLPQEAHPFRLFKVSIP